MKGFLYDNGMTTERKDSAGGSSAFTLCIVECTINSDITKIIIDGEEFENGSAEFFNKISQSLFGENAKPLMVRTLTQVLVDDVPSMHILDQSPLLYRYFDKIGEEGYEYTLATDLRYEWEEGAKKLQPWVYLDLNQQKFVVVYHS